MHLTIDFDPVIFSLGPLAVRWYGLMYVIGFLISGYLCKKLVEAKFFQVSADKIDSFITHMIIGMFVGARLGYVLVYNLEEVQSIIDVIAVWRGGLSFHGAILGFLGAAIVFAKRNKIPILQVTDVAVTAGAQGVFFGRLGNFINGELYGRVSDVPWAMIFPSGGPSPRHPSQLYEAFLEGILLFSILWLWRSRVKSYGILTSMFLFYYGTFRFIIEFFREADSQMGYYFGGTTTMGQILCFLMILSGAILYFVNRSTGSDLKVGQ